MAPKPKTIQDRMTRRVALAKKTHRLAEAHYDKETGAAVLLAQNSDSKLVALFFEPAVSTYFKEVEITAEQRDSLGDMLKTRQAEEKARIEAPHDLKVGDIFHYHFGATMRSHSFWRVTDIPHPRKITCVQLPEKVTWGTLEHGNVVPDLEAPIPDDAVTATFEISMSSGTPSLKTRKGEWRSRGGGRWDGQPQLNCQD